MSLTWILKRLLGLAVRNGDADANGLDVRSREFGTVADRPQLILTLTGT